MKINAARDRTTTSARQTSGDFGHLDITAVFTSGTGTLSLPLALG
jgi:hypothetical protein